MVAKGNKKIKKDFLVGVVVNWLVRFGYSQISCCCNRLLVLKVDKDQQAVWTEYLFPNQLKPVQNNDIYAFIVHTIVYVCRTKFNAKINLSK